MEAITLKQAWVYGGPLMWVLAGLSVLALAKILVLLIAQRRGGLAPRSLVSDVFSRLQAKDYGETRRLCDRRPCAFSTLVLAALTLCTRLAACLAYSRPCLTASCLSVFTWDW